MYKFIKKTIAIAALTLGITFSVQATHVMAGEITYKNVGKDSLEVTVTIYRDCNGIAMSNTPVTIKYVGGGSSSAVIPKFSSRDVTGIPVSCGISSRCSGSYKYGIEEYVFKGLIVLQNNSYCKVIFGWEQCCRNGVIITGAANANFYMETTYDKCLAPNNSSPRFLNLPVMLLPLGQDISITHAAVDEIDNDYITYELINPLSASGTNITYQSPWSASKPLTFLGFPNAGLSYPSGFRFDSLTSNMTFRPIKKDEVTVVTIKVTEWRKINGTLTPISEIIRDVQLLIYESPSNNPPKIDRNPNVLIKTCSPANNYCFVIPVTDRDSADTLKIDYKHNFKNVTVSQTVVSPNKVDVKVCFSIDSSVLYSGGSYFFTLYAQDDNCPLPGKAEKTFLLQIDSSGPVKLTLNPIGAICETAPPVTLLGAPAYGKWAGTGVSGDSVFTPSTAGSGWHNLVYTYNDTSSGCISKDSIRARVVKAPKAGFTASATTGLPTDVFTFTDTTLADTVYQRVWNMGQPLSTTNIQTTTTATHIYYDSGLFSVKLRVSNGICPPDSAIKNIRTDFPLSIENSYLGEWKIYPNPTRDYLFIQAETAITSITITDMLGRNSIAEIQTIGGETKLSVAGLPTGVYYLQATTIGGQVYTTKLMVER